MLGSFIYFYITGIDEKPIWLENNPWLFNVSLKVVKVNEVYWLSKSI